MPEVDRQAAHTATDGDTGSRNGAGSGDGRYPGGKGLAGLWQWIIGQMPPHSVYAEPFAGRAAIARRKTPALSTWLVEHDPTVVAWLRSIRYPGALVIQGDGTRWLEHAAERELLDDDALVYCDPPYVLGTRVKKRIYQRELSDREHEELLDVLRGLPCRVMISGYWSELYGTRLSDWSAASRPVITRGATMRDEWLWCNFSPPAAPASIAVEYSELGGDYRERERIARKVRRWQRNLAAMPERERAAVLRGLLDAANTAAAAGTAGGIDAPDGSRGHRRKCR